MDVHGQQTMLALIETLDRVEPRRLGKVPLEAVRPAMVFATQAAGRATTFLNDGVCPVATDIVEGVDVPTAVPDDEEGEISIGEGNETAGILEAKAMRDENPFLRKDGTAFQLIHGRRAVP